jgi:putative ABC transport system ATP-binding protein
MASLYIEGLVIERGDTFSIEVPILSISPGQCICISGESGSGKSTLLDVLALMGAPTRVGAFHLASEIGGALMDLTPALENGQGHRYAWLRSSLIGYAPQSGGMLPFLSALADVSAPPALSTDNPHVWSMRRDILAEAFDLNGHLAKTRGQLSGGQRKRVSLMRALALRRVLLVLDEPTAGLDQALAQRALRTIVQTAQADGTACVIASHDVALAGKAGFEIQDLGQIAVRSQPRVS